MDRLEQLISKNREKFDHLEPSDTHFANFEQKLNKQHEEREPKKKFFRLHFSKIAAILILALFVGDQLYDHYKTKEHQPHTLSELNPEYREAEMFYNTSINDKTQQLDQLVNNGQFSAIEQQIMKNELKEMSEIYDKLLVDLSAHPNDERVISAIIQFYQIKSDLLEQIIIQLKQKKQQNKKENVHTTI